MYKLIGKFQVDSNWPIVAPWIAMAMGMDAACWEGIDYIRVQACHGGMRIWTGHDPRTFVVDMVMVTEDHMIAGKPTLVVRWFAGEKLEDKFPDFGILEKWAHDNHYHRVQIWGRPGWRRLMKPLGYELEFQVITKDVDRGIH